MVSRNGNDMTAFPELAGLRDAVASAAAGPRCLRRRGCEEIVSFDAEGRPGSVHLQKRMHGGNTATAARLAASESVVLLLFDVLVLDGHSLLATPYAKRRTHRLLTPLKHRVGGFGASRERRRR